MTDKPNRHRSNGKTKQLIEKSNRFAEWIQEYTKKVVTLVFILYMIVNIYILIMVCVAYFASGELQTLDTLIVEINNTFRDVIGGYIIKAAVENVVKITGGIVDKFIEYKLTLHQSNNESESDDEFFLDDEDDEVEEEEESENKENVKGRVNFKCQK